MNSTTNNAAEESNQTSRKPTHTAYSVRDRGDGKKGEWRPVGVAWNHADGRGLTVHLDLMPLDGRVTLRVTSDEKKD